MGLGAQFIETAIFPMAYKDLQRAGLSKARPPALFLAEKLDHEKERLGATAAERPFRLFRPTIRIAAQAIAQPILCQLHFLQPHLEMWNFHKKCFDLSFRHSCSYK